MTTLCFSVESTCSSREDTNEENISVHTQLSPGLVFCFSISLYFCWRGECVDNGRCGGGAVAAAAAHAAGELAVTPPPGTVMVTVAPGSLETRGAMRPSASPRHNDSYFENNVNQFYKPPPLVVGKTLAYPP